MRTRKELVVPALTVAAGAALAMPIRRLFNPQLPRFDDQDPSGVYGDIDGELKRIHVLGDSSVTGPGLANPSDSWAVQLVKQLPYRVELHSFAKGGARVRDCLEQQAPVATEDVPDLFLVAVGGNDVLHGTSRRKYRRRLQSLLSTLGSYASVVTLGTGDLSVIPRVSPVFAPAVSRRCRVMDRVHAEVTEGLSGVVRVPVAELSNPHFEGAKEDMFVPDLFHPNEACHRKWGTLFLPHVKRGLASNNDWQQRSI